MVDFKNIDSFLRKLNEKCKAFLSFETNINTTRDNEINNATNECDSLIADMKKKLNQYIDKNFNFIKVTINGEIDFLIKSFGSDYNKTIATVESNIKNKANNEEIKQLLNGEISKYNNLMNSLNSDDLNSKIAKQTLTFQCESFVLTRGDESISYNCSSSNEFFDETKALSTIDKSLVREIFKCSKNIALLVDLMSENYQKQFDIGSFNSECKSKKKIYIEELTTNAATQYANELFNKFQSSEACKPYSDFFEEIERVSKQSMPDIDNGTNDFKETITIGHLKYQAIKDSKYMRYVEKSAPLAEKIDKNGYINIPLIASLRDKGNVLVTTNQNRFSDTLKGFIDQLILDFLLSFPARRIHFKLVDINDKMGFAPFSALRKINDNTLLDGIIRDDKQLEDAIENIKKIKFDAEDKLCAEGLINVFDYNEKFETAPMDIYVFVLIDFPGKIDSSLASKVRDIMLNGKNDGVFTILVNNESIGLDYNFPEEDYNSIISEISECSYTFDTNGLDKVRYLGEDGKTYGIELIDGIDMSKLGHVVEVLKSSADASTSKSIPLSDMFKYIDDTPSKSISAEMEIPFGQSGGDIQTLRLTNQSGPHAALIGTSGSGKSVLFHTLILDACYKYAPDELNFYLLDFKGGVEFKYYQNHKLPHIKVIGLTNDLNDGLAILASINKEISNRKKLFNEIGVSNIESYYKAGKKIPRLFVIIDEIQEILVRDEKIGEKALDILSEILAIGRSFGINILWGSQSVPHVSGIQPKLMQNITNRICLKVANSDYAMNMFGDSQALRAVENLNRPGIIGLGIIKDERTGASVKEFRVAYSEEGEKRTKYLERILSKWADVKCDDNLYVIGNDLVPDATKDIIYSANVTNLDVTQKSFESYWLSLGTDYVSGNHYPIQVFNSKERENVLMVGTNVDLLRDMMGYSLLSVVLNRMSDRDYLATRNNKIFYANKEGVNPKFTGDLFNVLPKELEEQIEIVGSGDRLFNCIKDLYCTYLERKDAVDNGQIPENYCSIYVLIHSMQYISDLFDENKNLDDSEFYSFDEEPSNKSSVTFNEAIKTLLKKGSQYGIHFIISINSIDAIREIRDELKQFNYKFATVGSTPSTFIEVPASQIPSILNDRIALFAINNVIEKIRPYRYDEQDKSSEAWMKGLIQKYSKLN